MKHTILALFLLVSLELLSSSPPFEFGSMTASEMDLDYYREKYPGEPAVVIGDVADCRFDYSSKKGFRFQLNREMRIIILSEAGLDYGDFSIRYYESRGIQEEISRFRAHVYNLDGNRVNKTRVREREGFTQDRQNNWKELTFAFPEVRVGSVIEVRYTLISGFLLHLRDWQFQREIPVLHSEYNLNLPTFYVYNISYNGLIKLDITEMKESSDNWSTSRNVQTGMRSIKYRWAAFDIPAVRPEPFTDNIRNYKAWLFFEFAHEQWPNKAPRHYSTTWNDVRKYLDNHQGFGRFLNEGTSALRPLLPSNLPETEEERLWAALEIIHENIRWNEDAAFMADNTPAEVINKGFGNAAEVNLLLVAMLRNLGVESYPVAVTTVSNGTLFSDSPTIIQWNYVVAMAKLSDGEQVLLDATVPKPVPGYLPQRAINDRGRAIDPNLNEWVNLESNIDFTEQNIYNLKLDENGDLSGSFEMQVGRYGKYSMIQEITMLGEERFWDQMFKDIDIRLSNKSIQYDIKDNSTFVMKADVHVTSYVSRIGDELIVPALLFERREENVFQSEERQYPVFFNNTLNSVTIINLELPGNISISYIPGKKSRRWGRFSYDLMAEETETGLKITWLNQRLIRIVPSRNYAGYRTWYSRMINDNLENIIVKVNKTNNADVYQNNE
jgi:hypothetical protein